MPETKGRSFGEIDLLFDNRVPARKFKSTDVNRKCFTIDTSSEANSRRQNSLDTTETHPLRSKSRLLYISILSRERESTSDRSAQLMQGSARMHLWTLLSSCRGNDSQFIDSRNVCEKAEGKTVQKSARYLCCYISSSCLYPRSLVSETTLISIVASR